MLSALGRARGYSFFGASTSTPRLTAPAPISLLLFILGTTPLGLAVVLGATALDIGAMLELYRRLEEHGA